jgi:hypothetical protein
MCQSTQIIDEYSDIQLIVLALAERNPGAHNVVSKLFEIIEKDQTKNDMIMNVIKDLLSKSIVGARLWYIYKNEAKLNINDLLNINLDQFTDEYFYEKFEKYL